MKHLKYIFIVSMILQLAFLNVTNGEEQEFAQEDYVGSFSDGENEGNDKSGSETDIENLSIIKKDQNLLFEQINREDGLASLSVSAVTQDKYGFLWIGTQGGLHRYDGENFYKYRYDPLRSDWLPNNLIQSMFYDEAEHALWLGTYGGISRFDIASESFENYTIESHGLANQVIVTIIKREDDIWFGTLKGTYRIKGNDGTLDYYPMDGRVIRSMYISEDGTFYIGSAKGLFIYDEDEDRMIQSDILSENAVIMSMGEYGDNIVGFGTWYQGLIMHDLITGEQEIILPGEDHIYTTYQTRDKTIWLATWGGGLYAYDHDAMYHYSGEGDDSRLSHPVAYSLFQDQSGILWIGTNGGGLNYVNPRTDNYLLYTYEADNDRSLSKGKVIDIFKDSKDRFWISVANQGLHVESRDGGFYWISNESGDNGIPSNNVRVVKEFEDKILLGTDLGIGNYSLMDEKFQPWNILQNKYIYDIEIASEHEIWIGTRENGLYIFNTETRRLLNFTNDINLHPITDNQIYDILIDSRGRAWIATNNGLNMREEGQEDFHHYFKDLTQEDSLPANQILAISEGKNGDIWLGFDGGGIARYDEDTDGFKVYTETNGLSNNTVTAILPNPNGEVWAATQDGISIINPEDDTIRKIGYVDGLGGYEFSEGSFAGEDYMYFGGSHGVNAIPYDYSLSESYVPKIYITGIEDTIDTDFGQINILNDQSIILSYDQNFIVFSFMALDFDGTHENDYYYMLEGYNEDFVNNGNNRRVSFTKLPAGDYVFKVYSKSTKDVRSEIASVTVSILPPWYLTMNAFVMYVFLFGLFIFLLIKLRESVVVGKKNKELAVVNQKLETANATLKDLSSTDGLTKAYNRRYFSQHLQEMIDLAKRNSSTYISLLMIDIDLFKDINDKYGHVTGDRLLIKISESIQTNLPRSTDILARYGGDEFAVILYDTKVNGALLVAQKIRRTVEGCKVEYKTDSQLKIEQVGTTSSIGVVSLLPDKESTEDMIINMADEALYQAKKSGRNCIVIYDELMD